MHNLTLLMALLTLPRLHNLNMHLDSEDTDEMLHKAAFHQDLYCWLRQNRYTEKERTSDGGNENHSVSLPIILIKIKVDQMLPSSYIS